jgi:Zn-finger nucleic acid-binding protein
MERMPDADYTRYRCPLDSSLLKLVDIDQGVAGVCQECNGICLPSTAVENLAHDPLTSGWLGYVHFARLPQTGLPCPAGHGQMEVFDPGLDEVVEQCARCRSLWLPGRVLQKLNYQARRRAGSDDEFPVSQPAGYLIGPAAVAAKLDPRVVAEFLFSAASVWR